jgi:hypothetical protein
MVTGTVRYGGTTRTPTRNGMLDAMLEDTVLNMH